MSFNVDFDQLFALRVFLQDDHENECDIITELRHELLNMGLHEENIPNILKEFYDNYGIDISLDVINEAIHNAPNNNQFQQLFNFINNNIQETLNSFQQNQPHQMHQGEENDIENNEENDEENETIPNPNLINLGNGFGIQLSFLPANLLEPNTTTNPFTNLINIINTTTTNNYGLANNFTDVVTTLEEEDLNNLRKFKTDKILEEKCSVCMANINIDEEVCELPCKHNFHNECIEPWLKQYNYKCPICRMEVGKPKHNIE